jgi:hypothetical protein
MTLPLVISSDRVAEIIIEDTFQIEYVSLRVCSKTLKRFYPQPDVQKEEMIDDCTSPA